MGAEVFEGMQTLTEQPTGLCEFVILAFEDPSACAVLSSVVDAAFEGPFDEGCTCGPVAFTVGYIV